MISHRKGREYCLQVLYAMEIGEIDLAQAVDSMEMQGYFQNQDKAFGIGLVEKVIEKRNELDEKIQSQSKNWDFARLATIDKLILQAGLTEILYFPDIPVPVCINEAVGLAKKYSTSESGKFVNGILGAVASLYNNHADKKSEKDKNV